MNKVNLLDRNGTLCLEHANLMTSVTSLSQFLYLSVFCFYRNLFSVNLNVIKGVEMDFKKEGNDCNT